MTLREGRRGLLKPQSTVIGQIVIIAFIVAKKSLIYRLFYSITVYVGERVG